MLIHLQENNFNHIYERVRELLKAGGSLKEQKQLIEMIVNKLEDVIFEGESFVDKILFITGDIGDQLSDWFYSRIEGSVKEIFQ